VDEISLGHEREDTVSPGPDGLARARRKEREVPIFTFAWGNNPRRAELEGRRCRIVARGRMGTVLVRFEDSGEHVTCSFRALRRA
jgi:hypothetical protein